MTPTIRSTAAGLGAAALALTGIALAAAPASAAPAREKDKASEVATVRVGHLSPDMPAVDVYLTSFTGRTSVVVRDATYGEVSRYQQVRPGSYTFALRSHGSPRSAAPLQSWSVDAKAGSAYTAAVAGVGSRHRGVVLDDDLTPPAKGHANIRFIQASSRAGTAQLDAVDGPIVAQDAPFGTSTRYASVMAGTWPLRATGDGQSARRTVSVAAGSVTSLILLDNAGGGTRLTSVIDAAGAAQRGAPRGSVDTGGGATAEHVTADRSAATGVAPAILTGTVAFLVAAATMRMRRRRVAQA